MLTMPTVYIEDGMDAVQNDLRDRFTENQKAQSALGRGLVSYFRRRHLQKEMKEIEKQYADRAYQLGLKATYRSGSHG